MTFARRWCNRNSKSSRTRTSGTQWPLPPRACQLTISGTII